MTTLTQPSLFDADLPTQTYDNHAPYRASDTSAAGAVHIEPKRLSLQQRVLVALYKTPGLTDAGLDRTLGTEAGRSARPRRRELELAGLVEQAGTCVGEAGVANATWQLTDAGVIAALALVATEGK